MRRVERVFEMHGVGRSTVSCPAIDGIITEANEVAGDVDDKQVLDAALIAAAQAVEHYEMTRYGAPSLGLSSSGATTVKNILHENLKEEKEADQKLTDIAESQVNVEASMSP